jgi:uncharacterized protein YgiM (DUF1202 family)
MKMEKKYARPAAALLALAFALAALGAAAAETYGVVSDTSSLPLLSEASSSGAWRGTYDYGTWVTVTGSSGDYYAVSTFDSQSGYMNKSFLDTTDSLTYGTVAIVDNPSGTRHLNLRSSPSYSATILKRLFNDVPLTVLSKSDGWYRVELGDTEGYVRSEYVYTTEWPLGTDVATIKTSDDSDVNMRTGPSVSASVIPPVRERQLRVRAV